MMFIIVCGNPADGFTYYLNPNGEPFTDPEEATDVADTYLDNAGDWWVVPVRRITD